MPMVFERLKQGKPANWLGNDQVRHSLTYTPDAGKALALLGNSNDAFNRIWHLPTDKNALTGKQFIEQVAQCLDTQPRYSNLSRWMMRMASLFNSQAREALELLYQNEYEYLFDSSKFENAFFHATDYRTGIEETVNTL